MRRLIDLSCDLGEASSAADRQVEEALWPLVTSANVACGGHAGDESSMRRAVRLAVGGNVLLGAHPSYPDRVHFGRKSLRMDPDELRASLTSQIRSLRDVASAESVSMTHVKPHGALYNDAHHDDALARLIVDAVIEVSRVIAVVASPRSALYRQAFEEGLPVVAEAFGDRRYRIDGSLVPRSEPNALLLEPEDAAAQAASLANAGNVRTSTGVDIEVPFATICIHADMPGSVARLEAIRMRLSSEGFEFSSKARFP